MTKRFTIEEHEKRMRGLLDAKPAQVGQDPKLIRRLLAKAKMKRKPVEGEIKV